MRWLLEVIALGFASLLPTSIDADVYAYDARGRLVGACQTTGGNAIRTEYQLDNADNRHGYRNYPTIVVIPANSSIWSGDGRFQLVMQGDGNLVIYGPSGPLWGSGTDGSGSNNTAVMQGDGNLVIYTQVGTPIWSSGTWGHPCSVISMQTDGNLVIYDLTARSLWASNTGGH